jgi:hypothetical protein
LSNLVRKVIDNSMLQSVDLQRYLRASPSHYAVLPDYVAIESYKVGSVDRILKRWEIISQFPRQALVLKGTSVICGLRGRGRGLQARLIDHKQTAGFPKFCAGLRRTRAGDPRYQRELLKLSSAAQREIDAVSAIVPRVMKVRRQVANTYSQTEVRAIRTRQQLSHSLTEKFVANVCLFFWMTMRNHPGVTEVPTDFDDGCNLFIFRFALCAHIWMLEWIADGCNEGANEEHVRNDLIDLQVATYGTFFDGLMTDDKKMAYIHALAIHMRDTMRGEPLPRR